MNTFFTPDVNRGTYDRIVTLLAGQMGMSPDQFVQNYKVMPSVLKLAQYLNTLIETLDVNLIRLNQNLFLGILIRE